MGFREQGLSNLCSILQPSTGAYSQRTHRHSRTWSGAIHERARSITTNQFTQLSSSAVAAMEWWNVPIRRITPFLVIFHQNHMARHSSHVAVPRIRKLGLPFVAANPLNRSFSCLLDSRIHQTIYRTVVASYTLSMDRTPSPTSPSRGRLHGCRSYLRDVYPRARARLSSNLGKYLSLAEPGSGLTSHAIKSCCLASPISIP